MGPIQSLEDVIGLIVRRRWLILVVAITGTLLGAWYAKSRPDVYEAAAVIKVEMPMVSGGTDPQGPVDALQTMQSIEQRLTTREGLLALIDRHGIFAEVPAMSAADKVAAMRGSIRFQPVSNAAGGGLSAIIVAAQADTADRATIIANDLAQGILVMGAQGQQAAVDASTTFFKEEEARLWQTITALEAEIAAYRESNRAALPGAREARLDELGQVDTNIRELDQDLAGLQSEDAGLRALPTQRATDRRRLEEIAQRIAVVNAQRAPLLDRKAALDGSLGDVAEVDRVLSAYDRQLGQLQDQYSVVSTRLAEAETTQRLSSRQQTEHFSLLEGASTPDYPIGSGGRTTAMAGAIASVGLALALALMLDLLRPLIRTSAQMERELNLRPIVAIPEVPARARAARKRKPVSTLIEDAVAKTPALGPAVLIVGAALVLTLTYAAMT